MSNKKWRTPPAGAGGKTGSEPVAGDDGESGADSVAASAPQAHSAGSGQADPPPTMTKASSGDEAIALEPYPADYVDRSNEGDFSQLPDGCYRMPTGAGFGCVDMRQQFGGLGPVGSTPRPMTDAEVKLAARDSVRFLWQIMNMTSRLLESVQLGDLRKVVAADFAMPGDAILADGTISKHPDVVKVKDGALVKAPASSPAPEPDKPETSRHVKAARRPRGSTHPFLALLRLAVQAARLIKQISAGTHPEVHNKIVQGAKTYYDKFREGEAWARSVVNRT